ncbi:hypothetical protein MG1_04292 [Candida albicans GC75]|nr:hypothetical protein MG1_04292 [Candida albicans GC75]
MYRKSIGEIRRSSLEERLDSSMTNDSLTTGIRNGAYKSSTNRKFSTEFNSVDTKNQQDNSVPSLNQENQLDDTQSDRFDQQSIPPLRKRKSWFAGVLRRRKPSLVNDIQSAPPVQQQQQNNKSKSWLFKSKAEADSTLVLNTAQYSNIRSAESDQAELLSTGSVDRNNKSNSIQFESRNLEYDDTIPIFFGKYSGSPMCTSILKNTQIVYFQLSAYNSLYDFDEATYHPWNIWEVDEDMKKLRGTIDGKDDFTEFAKEFEYSQVLLMRSWLVPNYEIFKNGYLIQLKINHKKNDTQKAINLYLSCSRDSIFKKLPEQGVQISVCGIRYFKKTSQLSEVIFWIHPIKNMSFSIIEQVVLLLKSFKITTSIHKTILVDLNNGSRSTIKSSYTY